MQCQHCGSCFSDSENGQFACVTHHARPWDVWIVGKKAVYPALYYPCCSTYRSAIPGVPQRPFNPICRVGPHVARLQLVAGWTGNHRAQAPADPFAGPSAGVNFDLPQKPAPTDSPVWSDPAPEYSA
ncbi:hypothetical protein TRAPUB_7896 [Trametes pubescens]|uniref:Uncharacterized protein n=1 Tax=Trametes pubescens TaxID=154538 RepID=A0A1M2V235_TRAPU|nr:hypothetical protein TRAPUB_7896 [Trametes pubescens]